MKHGFCFFAAALAAALLCGCEMLEDTFDMNIGPYDPSYVVGIHAIVKHPRGGLSETIVATPEGKTLTVASTPYIHSEDIRDVKLLPRNDRPNFYDFSIQLSQTGARKWMILCSMQRDDSAAILVDGAYYCRFLPEGISDVDIEWVTLVGPFDESFALGIKKYVRKNFRHFSPKATAL